VTLIAVINALHAASLFKNVHGGSSLRTLVVLHLLNPHRVVYGLRSLHVRVLTKVGIFSLSHRPSKAALKR
jgi:hypothetical protein